MSEPSSSSGAVGSLALNLYLGLFALDAVLQGVGLLVGPLGPIAIVSRTLLLLMTVGAVFGWVLFARLPWRLLVAFLVLGWLTAGMMPVPAILLNLNGVAAAGVVVQLLVAGALVGFRVRDLPLDERALRPGRDVRLLVSIARAALLGGSLIAGVVFQLWAVAWSLDHVTDGYVRVDTTGLETAHRACTKDGKTIHLVGAVHIGQSSGYDELLAGIPAGSLLLAEGVTDVDGHLGEGFGYGKLAGRLGLVPQRSEGVGDSTEGEDGSLGEEGGGRFRVQRADVDVNSFHKETLSLLGEVGTILGADDPVAAYIKGLGNLGAVTEDTLGLVIHDVLMGRNEHLPGVIDEVLPAEDVLVVPWGAMHLRDVGRGIQERGFLCGEPRYIRMIEWATIREALAARSSGAASGASGG